MGAVAGRSHINDMRREAAGMVNPQIILDERHWLPFKPYHYRHTFAKIRDKAAETCPSLADFRDQDLRDTAVTWMGFAEATIPQICSVTGHSVQSAHTILKQTWRSIPEWAAP